MTTRTDRLGNCYEYDKTGKRLAGDDRMTIDAMLAYSRKWPETYHQYMAADDGHIVWARNGEEIPDPFKD